VSERALLDTSVVIALEELDPAAFPPELAVSCVTLAELAVGPLVASNASERRARIERLRLVEMSFEALPVDAAVARAYGQLNGAVALTGRTARRRAFDLLIGATAVVHGLPVYTRNPDDLRGLDQVLEIVVV
jgi:predicted nucleic acid-binding protein